jgi:hypothetical protein
MAGNGDSIGIIDLDAVLQPDIKVKLDDHEYRLPGDPPAEILLTIVVLSESLEEAIGAEDSDKVLDLRRELTDAVTDLFSMRQEVDDNFGSTLVDAQIQELVSKLFAHYYGLDQEDGDRPTSEEPEAAPSSEAPEEAEPASSTPPRPRSARRSPPRSRKRPAAKKRPSASSKSSTT